MQELDAACALSRMMGLQADGLVKPNAGDNIQLFSLYYI